MGYNGPPPQENPQQPTIGERFVEAEKRRESSYAITLATCQRAASTGFSPDQVIGASQYGDVVKTLAIIAFIILLCWGWGGYVADLLER